MPGARPFNYLKMVQPVLDRRCVGCHDGTKKNCPSLKGDRQGWTCESFNTLVKHVSYSGWNKQPNNNYEPLTMPLTFGALASPRAGERTTREGKEIFKEAKGR